MWVDYVNATGVVVAFGFAAFQARRLVTDARQRDKDRRVERALDLYRDLVVEGDTAAAFNQLSVMLRALGTKKHSTGTWLVLKDAESAPGGLLDPAVTKDDTFQNLYRVLWFYERVETSLTFDLVDQEVMFRTIGFHCWWWDQLLHGIHAPKAAKALHELAPQAAAWARRENVFDDWVARCQTDFDGGPPTPV